MFRPDAEANEISQSRPSDPGKGLTRRSAGYEGHTQVSNQSAHLSDRVVVAEIPICAQAGVIRTMRLKGKGVVVYAEDDIKSCVCQTQT